MRKEKTLMILGIWIAILPYLGFYDSFRRVLYIFTGLFIIYIGYLLYTESKIRQSKNESKIKSFVDNIGIGE